MLYLPLPQNEEPESLVQWAKNLKTILEEFLLKVITGQIKISNIDNIHSIKIEKKDDILDGSYLIYDATTKTLKWKTP